MLQDRHTVVASDRVSLARETIPRPSNDLDLVISLLSMQGRKAANPQVREALSDAILRVVALARGRSAQGGSGEPSLAIALRLVCDALRDQAEFAAVEIALRIDHDVSGYTFEQIGMLALIVNELAINAMKHAFKGSDGGAVTIALRADSDGTGGILSVEDTGSPLPGILDERGLGLLLVRRLAAAMGCIYVPPQANTKLFIVKLPQRPTKIGVA